MAKKRDKAAALAFIKKALKRHGRAKAIVTDGLRFYPAAMRELGIPDRREMARWQNNRVENSHLPFRRRERAMPRFRRMKTVQKFVSVHAPVHNHFNHERHLVDRQTSKTRRSAALAAWQALAACTRFNSGLARQSEISCDQTDSTATPADLEIG